MPGQFAFRCLGLKNCLYDWVVFDIVVGQQNARRGWCRWQTSLESQRLGHDGHFRWCQTKMCRWVIDRNFNSYGQVMSLPYKKSLVQRHCCSSWKFSPIRLTGLGAVEDLYQSFNGEKKQTTSLTPLWQSHLGTNAGEKNCGGGGSVLVDRYLGNSVQTIQKAIWPIRRLYHGFAGWHKCRMGGASCPTAVRVRCRELATTTTTRK